MKCSVIRDLLPLYQEKICSEGASRVIENHIEICDECREIFDYMKGSLTKDDLIEDNFNHYNNEKEEDRLFWMKYYKGIYLKGLSIFFFIYCIFMFIGIFYLKIRFNS